MGGVATEAGDVFMIFQLQPHSRRRLSAHAKQGACLVGRRPNAFHQNFNPPTRGLLCKKPCRNHLGIVEDQQVLRVQKINQVGEPSVVKVLLAVHIKQPALASHLGRRLGNKFFRQFKIKVG